MFIEFYCRDTYVQSLPIDLMRHFFFLIIWPWEIHNFAKFKHVAPFEFFNVVVGCFMIKLPEKGKVLSFPIYGFFFFFTKNKYFVAF